VGADVIDIVEAAYDLRPDYATWLRRVLDQMAPRLDRGFGVTVQTYVPGVGMLESACQSRHLDSRVKKAMFALADARPDIFETINTPPRQGHYVTATQQLVWPRGEREPSSRF
jgi:hypothetical protein